MKIYIALIVLIFTMMSCIKRTDKIFAAMDELYYIHLYEKENEFEILYNGVNKAIGTYSLIGDTVKLTYNANKNGNLTKILIIDTIKKKIKSLDDKHFCADIYLDKRIDK